MKLETAPAPASLNIFSIQYMRKATKGYRIFDENKGAFMKDPTYVIKDWTAEIINQDFRDIKPALASIPKEAGIKYIGESLKFSKLLKDTFILNNSLIKDYL